MTASKYDFNQLRAYTVVKDGTGTEYFAVKVNPKNLVVMSMEDGRLRQGPHRIFTVVRPMNAEDRARHLELEAQWAENPENPRRKRDEASAELAAEAAALPRLGLGMRVRLGSGVRIGTFPADVDYVVIGVNAKTYNIVPLGGFGNGSEYARVYREHLTLVEE